LKIFNGLNKILFVFVSQIFSAIRLAGKLKYYIYRNYRSHKILEITEVITWFYSFIVFITHTHTKSTHLAK